MSQVFLISDLHLGHKKVLEFEPEHRFGKDITEHDYWLLGLWNATVRKRDLVYVLGDVTWTPHGFQILEQMHGEKTLIMGNHDTFPLEMYLSVFKRIRPSPFPYKGYWLSHCPIHPTELRGRKNIHGHVHSNTLPDERYYNASVEAVAGIPRTLQQLEMIQQIRFKQQQGEWRG